MQKHHYISVMGTMGTGKTTATNLISKHFPFYLIEENFGENAFLPKFYKNMKRWAFHSQTFFLMEKITQLLSIHELLPKHHIVQDTPIQQDVFSYAQAHHRLGNMSDEEWKLYQKIYHSSTDHLPKPELIIYLKASIPVVIDRVKKRGRSYEQDIPKSYFELLDTLNHEWLKSNKDIPVLTIETDNLNIVTNKKAKETFLSLIQKECNI